MGRGAISGGRPSSVLPGDLARRPGIDAVSGRRPFEHGPGGRQRRREEVVEETEDDLTVLQTMIDRSHSRAGPHLREIITPERRLTARQLSDRLTGMRLLALATVTSDNRPLVGPVDGIFYRGAFHFGSSPDSVRVGHIRQRPQVSATHLPGEEWAVTVHGRATVLDLRAPDNAGLRQVVLGIYTPQYGEEWESFLDANVYARIDADRIFTFHLE
jgi:Pyridoxamine 5'-phosphate oxidase